MRLDTLIKKCKRRGSGGDCPCRTGQCQAEVEIKQSISDLSRDKQNIEYSILRLREQLNRLGSHRATLKDGWEFDIPKGYSLSAVCEGDVWVWGYADIDDNWINGKGWPFNENYVYSDDWEHYGFEVI